MAHCSRSVSRTPLVSLALLCVCLVLFTLPFKFKRTSHSQLLSCQQCLCDCSDDIVLTIMPSSGFTNTSLPDCGEDVPGMKEEMGKDLVALTVEELHLHRTVANETLGRTESLTLHANVASLHYRREAEKCLAGVESCEVGRERAEAELAEERRLSDLWQRRARDLGWQ